MNLKEISLFLTEPIVLIPEETFQRKTESAPAISRDDVKLLPEENLTNRIEEELVEEELVQEKEIAFYEGNFQKGLLVLYQGSKLPDPSQAFLMNILKAVNHSLKDIALISEEALLSGHPESINRLNPQNILIFGKLNHSIMTIKKENYTLIQADSTILFADDLKELESNKPLKIKLWAALQVLFNIK